MHMEIPWFPKPMLSSLKRNSLYHITTLKLGKFSD